MIEYQITEVNVSDLKKQPNPFIFVKKDGSWHINGGLVFCRQFMYKEFGEEPLGPKNTCSNVHVISYLPKWWQIIKWWQLIQKLNKYVESSGGDI